MKSKSESDSKPEQQPWKLFVETFRKLHPDLVKGMDLLEWESLCDRGANTKNDKERIELCVTVAREIEDRDRDIRKWYAERGFEQKPLKDFLGFFHVLGNYDWQSVLRYAKEFCKSDEERAEFFSAYATQIEEDIEVYNLREEYEAASSLIDLPSRAEQIAKKLRGTISSKAMQLSNEGNADMENSLDSKKPVTERMQNTMISPDCHYPHTPEQIKAYDRVATIYEKQPFWSGSFSDFVFAMNEFAMKGYLTHVEFEKAVAETFVVKKQGAKTPQKINSEKIKKRKRELDNGDLSGKRASPTLRKTMNSLLESISESKK